MIELDELCNSDIEWYVSVIKDMFVSKNTLPQNYNKVYQNSKKRKKFINLIDDALPGFFAKDIDPIEELIKSPFDKLLLYKKAIDKKKYHFSDDWQCFKKGYDILISRHHNITLVDKYGIKCCPYCNENFIFNRGNRSGCQLDHFFPKEQYPIFSLCLYNLIPVCSICNHIKLNKNAKISPQDHSTKTKNDRRSTRLTYELTRSSESGSQTFLWPYSEESIEIQLNSTSPMFKHDFKLLLLDKGYQYHKDYILEIINKAIIYNNCSVESILSSFEGLQLDEEEVFRYLFGNYYWYNDLLKRPLSKLTRDLLIELEIEEEIN